MLTVAKKKNVYRVPHNLVKKTLLNRLFDKIDVDFVDVFLSIVIAF